MLAITKENIHLAVRVGRHELIKSGDDRLVGPFHFGFQIVHLSDEAIRPWMSVGYVARSYHVPPPVLYRAIDLNDVPRDRRPLREIAREQNRPVEVLITDLQKAIADFRAHPEHFPPPQSNEPKSP